MQNKSTLEIHAEAEAVAKQAGEQYIAEHGEPMYCGFASTKIYGVKASTKLGKAFKAAGITKDYSGAFSIWNPSEWGGQSMDVKEAGAQACADVFRKYGFRSYMDSRAD